MLRTLTHDEMLKLWRTAAGLEPLRSDCRVERVEGLDADAVIEPRMRSWYLRLLDTAPPQLLPVADVADRLTLTPDPAAPRAAATLPDGVRRLLSLRLTGWMRPAGPADEDEASRRAALALNPYLRPGPHSPLCITRGRRLTAAPFEDGDIVAEAMAVTDPGPELYILDESLLDTIPDILHNYDNF